MTGIVPCSAGPLAAPTAAGQPGGVHGIADWVTDLLDLVLARACLACGLPGRAWCQACLASCPRDLTPARPVGADADAALVSATRYDGVVREAIVDYKEHGNRALAPMLGRLLAEAIAEHPAVHEQVVLVRVPGHRRPARGFDALGGVLGPAREHLAGWGVRAPLVAGIRLATDPGPVKYLDRVRRQAAVRGAMRPGRARALGRLRVLVEAGWPVVVVDDVVTTGGTVAAAAAALTAAGLAPAGAAAIARAGR